MKINSFLEPLSQKNMEQNLTHVLQYILDVAETESGTTYTTGDLSKYFGVSITSINNWINGGRFIGVTRSTPGKQARISEDTMWRASNGKMIPIKAIIEKWNLDYSHKMEISGADEKAAIIEEIKFFEDKYGLYGEFIKKEHYTDLELKDKKEWEYWLKRATE